MKTYELSNEQTIVRWSQSAPTDIWFRVENSVDEKEDWNWLVGRVNIYVAAHTHLPLLDLSDEHQPHIATQQDQQDSTQKIDNTDPIVSIKIAQNDPQVKSAGKKMTAGLIVMAISALLLFLFVCNEKFWNTGATHLNTFDVALLNFAFWFLGLFAVLMLLFMWLFWLSFRNQRRIQAKRQQAVLHPERFQLAEQPTASMEQPQPARLQLITRKITLFLITFIEVFIFWFIIQISTNSPSLKSLLITFISSCLFATLISFFFMIILRQSTRTRIEVNTEGISTRTGAVESHIRWQDAHLFARYKPMGIRQKSARAWVYELASEQTLVRWQWPRSQKWKIVEPAMTQEEYNCWLDELQRYVMARTELPLLEFDAP